MFQVQDQSGEGLSDESENGLRKLTEKPDSEQFQSLIRSQNFKNLFDQYETFINSVRNGIFEKTAQFWLGYMDIIWLILCFIRATKKNNFELHLTALYELCQLFFPYYHYNYSRYMPACLVTLGKHMKERKWFRRNSYRSWCMCEWLPSKSCQGNITIEHQGYINCSWKHPKDHYLKCFKSKISPAKDLVMRVKMD